MSRLKSKNAGLVGPASVRFSIDRDGALTSIAPAPGVDAANRDISQCVADAIRLTKFPSTPQVVGHVTLSNLAAEGDYVVHFTADD